MGPKRSQPTRQAAQQSTAPGLDPEVIKKRTKRHLDELERSNYSEPLTALSLLGGDEDDGGPGKARGRGHMISDRADAQKGRRKSKSSANVRTAVVYRKNLATLIDESGIANLPVSQPTYLTAAAPPPAHPPRMLCTVCGYWGAYKCMRCAMAYCGAACGAVHAEVRCERRVV